MYKLKSIGKIKNREDYTEIKLEKEYYKALKYLDQFSHMHVFFIRNGEQQFLLQRSIVKIIKIDRATGSIISSPIGCYVSEMEVIDLKPYFPSEDTVREACHATNKEEACSQVQPTEDKNIFTISSIGQIRNVKGQIYIQLEKMPPITTSYITIFWWFHKLDTKHYREVTECEPPYENAPRSGVFATRSPVRPNPIAMTVARILAIDEEQKRIYINNVESFDRTPCIGIEAYDTKMHCIKECSVPTWLRHWPKYFDETVKDLKHAPVKIIESHLSKLLQEISLNETSLNEGLEEQPRPNAQLLRTRNSGITVYGARENNLKNINVTIPYGKITAVVGVSGSGKSSLVNDTIYAECRRRMNYLSERNDVFSKPQIDEIIGCIPAVMIKQEAIRGNASSTIGTYTDVFDYLRGIYANVAIRHCPDCGNEIIPLSRERILMLLSKMEDFQILNLANKSILEEKEGLEKLVDRALEEGEGAFYVITKEKEQLLLQTKQKCFHCNKIMFALTPSTFSYLDSDARCPVCNGSGKVQVVDETKLIEHPNLSLLEGASSFYGKLSAFQKNPNANWMKGQVFALADQMGIDLKTPWCALPDEFKQNVLKGSNDEVTFSYHNHKNGRKGEITRKVEGICAIIERLYDDNKSSVSVSKYIKTNVCDACKGERLAGEGRTATINGIRYPEVAQMTFEGILDFCNKLNQTLSRAEYQKIQHSVASIIEICNTAIELGIGYLALNQDIKILSSGERQRIKLLNAFKNHLSGILYIFDEPSKGLHPDDYQKIMVLMKKLIDEGNTIIMVEHNEDMIKIADYVIEMGPEAGESGGCLIGEGTLAAMLAHKGTQLHKYLNVVHENTFAPIKLDQTQHPFLSIENLTVHNLKNVKVKIPMQALSCICGVSGSGKTSLMDEIYQYTCSHHVFKKVVRVDQAPIGKTSKSIVATYTGIMDFIRTVFAKTPVALQNGWDESYFSFNNAIGCCDTCGGEGKIKVKYTENTFIKCPDCNGKRYKKQILTARYNGKNINEILNLSISQAIELWNTEDEVNFTLRLLEKVGLGYLKLGQGTSTLSGGEASRLKLAKELDVKAQGNAIYLLDEPTTGLHFSDIENLLKLIEELIDSGNTVIAIEHNKQFVKHCTYKIELGPGAGEQGGMIISQG